MTIHQYKHFSAIQRTETYQIKNKQGGTHYPLTLWATCINSRLQVSQYYLQMKKNTHTLVAYHSLPLIFSKVVNPKQKVVSEKLTFVLQKTLKESWKYEISQMTGELRELPIPYL